MNKRVLVMISILVIVLGVVVGGFIYDRNDRLIARTTGLVFEDGYEIETVYKHGLPFRRSAYEAKVRIPHDDPEAVMNALYDQFGKDGGFLTYAQYYEMAKEVFTGVSLTPKVENGTNVWALGIDFSGKESLFFLIVSEDADHAYLYIYYSRY